MVVRQCYQVDDESPRKSLKIWPLATLKPLNRSSPKFASVLTSRIYLSVYNYIQIGPGFIFSPYWWNITPHSWYGNMFVFRPSSRLQPRPSNCYSRKYVRRRGSMQRCAFWVFYGKRSVTIIRHKHHTQCFANVTIKTHVNFIYMSIQNI